MIGVAILGGIIERLLFRYLYGREELYQLLFTYALVLILGDTAKYTWGTEQRSVSWPKLILNGSFEVFGTIVPDLQPLHHCDRAADCVGRVVDADAHRARPDGASGRARPRDALDALGANVGWLYTCMFMLSAASLAGLAGALVTPIREHRAGHGCRDHRPGLHRCGDWWARFVLGHVLGLGALWPGIVVRHPYFSGFSLFSVFALMAVILIVRPWGLFGRPIR